MLTLKKIAIVATVSAAALSYSVAANAASVTSSASVSVADPYTITEVNPVNFGAVVAPGAGQNPLEINLDANTSVVTKVSGDGDVLATVTPAAGVYNINPTTATATPDFKFQVSGVTAAASGVTLNAFNGYYNGGVVTLTNNAGVYSEAVKRSYSATPGDQFKLGGNMVVPAGTAAGTHTVSFDVSVIYN